MYYSNDPTNLEAIAANQNYAAIEGLVQMQKQRLLGGSSKVSQGYTIRIGAISHQDDVEKIGAFIQSVGDADTDGNGKLDATELGFLSKEDLELYKVVRGLLA
jgi:hypothetical protein